MHILYCGLGKILVQWFLYRMKGFLNVLQVLILLTSQKIRILNDTALRETKRWYIDFPNCQGWKLTLETDFWVHNLLPYSKWVAATPLVSPSNEHPGLISFRMDWLDLLAVQGTLKRHLQYHRSKASILQLSAFFIVYSFKPL